MVTSHRRPRDAAGEAAVAEDAAGAAAVGPALVRVAVGATLLLALALERPWRWAGLDDAYLDPPGLGGELIALLPRSEALVATGSVVLAVAGVALVVGSQVRLAACVAVVVGTWVLGVPQLFGRVTHYHHVIWLAALIAAVPATVTAARPPGSAAGERNRFLLTARALVAATYFFPGIAKLRASPEWVTSGALENTLVRLRYEKQWDFLAVPPSWTIPVIAAGTIVFEIGFLPSVLTGRLVRWFTAAGLFFHVATGVLTGLWFWPLLPMYVFMFDWRRAPARLDWRAFPVLVRRRDLPSVVTAGVAVGIAVWGLPLRVHDWPMATYPVFSDVERVADATRVAVRTDGQERWASDLVVPWGTDTRRTGFEQLVARGGDALEELRSTVGDGATIVAYRLDVSVPDEPRVLDERRLAGPDRPGA